MKRQPSQEDSNAQSMNQQSMGYQPKPRPDNESNYQYQQQRQQYYLQQQMKGQYPQQQQRQPVPQNNYSQVMQQFQQQRMPPSNYPSDHQIMQNPQANMIQQQQVPPHQSNQLLSTIDIKGLTSKISSKEVLDQHVEKTLALLAEDFVKNIAEFSCKLAKHRGSDTLEKEDIKFAIEKLYNIPTPIKPNSDKPSNVILNQAQIGQVSTSNYKQNMALVKKANDQNVNQ